MAILAFDTSQGYVRAAINSQGKNYTYISDDINNQSETIVTAIDELIKKANLTYDNISQANVIVGPGSFTGIRIAIAVAKGLKITHKIYINPISNFAAIAATLNYNKLKYNSLLVIFDCGKNKKEFYYQIIDSNYNSLCDAAIISYDDLYSVIPKENYIIAGNFDPKSLQGISNSIQIYDNYNIIDITAILSIPKLKINEVKPLYIRPTYVNSKS